MYYSFPINSFVNLDNLVEHDGRLDIPMDAINNYLYSFKSGFKIQRYGELNVLNHIVKCDDRVSKLIEDVKVWSKKVSEIDSEKEYEYSIDKMRIESEVKNPLESTTKEDAEKEIKIINQYLDYCNKCRIAEKDAMQALDVHFQQLARSFETNLIVSTYQTQKV